MSLTEAQATMTASQSMSVVDRVQASRTRALGHLTARLSR